MTKQADGSGDGTPAQGSPQAGGEGGAPKAGEGAAGAAGGHEAGAAGGAEIAYQAFKLPDTVKFDDAALGKIHGAFKGANLDQAGAQAIVDMLLDVGPSAMQGVVGPLVQDALAKEQDGIIKGWVDQGKADKDIGGAKYDAAVAESQRVIAQLGTPELKAVLETSGLGSHPEVIRLLTKVAPMLGEGKHVPAGGTGATEPPLAQIYDHPTSRAQLKYG